MMFLIARNMPYIRMGRLYIKQKLPKALTEDVHYGRSKDLRTIHKRGLFLGTSFFLLLGDVMIKVRGLSSLALLFSICYKYNVQLKLNSKREPMHHFLCMQWFQKLLEHGLGLIKK